MAADFPDQYYTEAGRLESFQTAQPLPKRRGSNATGRAPKSMKWPHSWLKPEKLAAAGFFFVPSHEHNDNVMCFLCREAICGWEAGDDPLVEHLKLSPDCGWAITSCIEARVGDMHLENPMSSRMVEARRATFGDRWPHEGKKGWKCKTKQLVEAGWIHKPTPEGDDYAECVYCTLALDGWEPADKPFHEHHARSQDCAFFELCNQPESPIAKKAAKTRKPRASKASRLSTQSALTEAPSMINIDVDEGDSVMTTATTASQATRKMTKGKKSTAKGRKKKDEPTEVSVLPEPEDEEMNPVTVEQPKPKRGKKRASVEMEDSAGMMETQAPPAKRRTRGSMAVQESAMHGVSMKEETSLPEQPAAKKAAPKKKGRASKTSRKVSTDSRVSLPEHIPDEDEIDRMLEEDLNRPLSNEEDPVDIKAAVQEEVTTSKASTAPTRRTTRTSKITRADHSMFSTAEVEIDEAALEAELEAMEIEESKPLPKARGAKTSQPRKVSAKQQAAAAKKAAQAEAAAIAAEAAAAAELEEAEAQLAQAQADAEARRIEEEHEELEQQLKPAPKARVSRAAKAKPAQPPATRRTRGSTMSVNESMVSAVSRQEDSIATMHNDSGNETDASQATVVRGGKKRGSAVTKKAKGGRKVRAQNIEDIIQPSIEEPQMQDEEMLDQPLPPPPQPQRQRANVSKRVAHIEDLVADDSVIKSPPAPVPVAKAGKARTTAKTKGKAPVAAPTAAPVAVPAITSPSPIPDADPVAVHSPIPNVAPVAAPPTPTPPPAARTRATSITPSPSPQSSDAENRPPSSRPSKASVERPGPIRVPLATTPGGMMGGLSKGNVVGGGLKSVQPWTGVDLDEVFGCLRSVEREREKENVGGGGGMLFGSPRGVGKGGELSAAEKAMSVEEWIGWNAGVAEERLRRECERMVGCFEREGGRAMRALEGVEVVE